MNPNLENSETVQIRFRVYRQPHEGEGYGNYIKDDTTTGGFLDIEPARKLRDALNKDTTSTHVIHKVTIKALT